MEDVYDTREKRQYLFVGRLEGEEQERAKRIIRERRRAERARWGLAADPPESSGLPPEVRL